MSNQNNWYNQLKQAVKDNIPVIVTIGSAITAVATIISVKESLESNSKTEELLKAIEEKIAVAIEAPTIVKVEIGDDFELMGTGNRVD